MDICGVSEPILLKSLKATDIFFFFLTYKAPILISVGVFFSFKNRKLISILDCPILKSTPPPHG